MPTPRQPIECPKPGVHRDIPMDIYHKIDAVSASVIKKADLDPQDRCWADVKAYMDGDAELPSYAMYFGRAAHAALLEDDTESLLEVAEFTNPQTKRKNKLGDSCKAPTLLACQAEYPDEYIVAEGDIEKIEVMVAKVRSHPTIGDLLDLPSERELTLIWEDHATGLMCKARLDWWIPPGKDHHGIDINYKTTADVRRRKFESDSLKFGYFISNRFYRRGIIALGLDDNPTSRTIAQAKSGSHQCRIWFDHYQLEECADIIIEQLLAGYGKCFLSGEWPGYSTDNLCNTAPLWLISKFPQLGGAV